MASGSATELIFFVSALIVATAVVAVAANGVYDLTNGINDQGEQVSSEMSTRIVIINDPSAMPNDPLLIYVQNTGSTTLNHNYISVMLDGVVTTDYSLSLSGNRTSFWDPASLLTISVDVALSSGDYTVQVTTENGISDTLSFRI